jgi:Helicase conserved C-terminal domain
MHDEYKDRARKHGLSFETWTGDNSTPSSQLILVAVEDCTWERFKSYAETLIRLGRLARIVVDEAHLLHKHASFRPCVDALEFLGRMPISILLMTATCPPHLEQSLFAKLGRQIYQVIRRGTDRPEIAQTMVAVPSEDMEKAVAVNILSITQQFCKPDRALLFCSSRDECDRMSELLGWKPYHSAVSLEERQRHKQLWQEGEVVGLACTSMLNCCLDHPTVRVVFHLGPPRDAIDYSQAIGRASRNGCAGQAIVYFDPSTLKKPTGDDPYGYCAIFNTLQDNSTCRRLRIALFLDGHALPCSMLPGAQLCDVCQVESARAPPENGPLRFPTHLLPASTKSKSIVTSARTSAPSPSVAGAPSQPQAQTLYTPRANPINQPAPIASFGNHFAAAQAALKLAHPTGDKQCGFKIRTACEGLIGSCTHCWAHGLDYHSHDLKKCQFNRMNEVHPVWSTWDRLFKLPLGCCFFCGCPLKVRIRLFAHCSIW